MNDEMDKAMDEFIKNMLNDGDGEQLLELLKKVDEKGTTQTAREMYVEQHQELEDIVLASMGLLEGRLPRLFWELGKAPEDEKRNILKDIKLHLDVIKSLREIFIQEVL